MDFNLSEEQQMIIKTTKDFVANELYPHENEVEETGVLRPELRDELKAKAIEAGLFAANMPAEVGGAGLDTLTWCLYEKELGRANYALHWTCVGRPSNILMACNAEQRERYTLPAVRGEKADCLAMTEPGVGSDLRGMKTFARQDGDDFVINGVKHFISHGEEAHFTVLFAATGEEQTSRGTKKLISAFLIDKGTPGFTVRPGYKNVSHRGYPNSILEFNDCRVHKSQLLGELHKGFEVANSWLGATRLQVASTCLGRAERALEHALQYAVDREQFGQQIGKFQGVSFKLADMAMELKAAELLTREAAWKYDQGTVTEADMSMAKLKATEVLAFIADEAIQIHGGMGLMSDLPLERIWRDARVERIWEGTSEIQRHIISRALLRPFGGLMSLDRLVFPKSIVFIGGNECAIGIRRCQEFGFPGKIYAVHPKRDEIAGIRTLKSVSEVDGPIDAAFIAVKREPTIEVVRELRARGCGGAVIYASGFAETGDHALQDQLLAAADGMPLMGPNCYGFVNGLTRAALWPDEHGIKPIERGIAIISQSGNIACNMTFTRRALPLAAVFTIGNQVDVDMAKMVDFLSADDRITAIGLHVEGLPDVAAFAAACETARLRGKPVVMLKTGRSEQGAAVAMSHTSSLAGADSLYDALATRYGVARVRSITAFVETLKFLHSGSLQAARIVSCSCSGGEAALTADIAMGRTITLPDFDDAARSRVRATLNEYVSVSNPLDYHTFIWNQPEKMEATFTAVHSGGYDVGMLILDAPPPPLNAAAWYVAARAFAKGAMANKARAAVVATLPECMPLDLADELLAMGVSPMFGLDDALTAFELAAQVGKAQGKTGASPLLAPTQLKDGVSQVLTERDAKSLLASYGLEVPEGQICKASEAVKVAQQLGFPVTLKVSSADIAHKTEAGGVILNLKTSDEVAAAAEKLSRLAPDVLVERMVTGAVAELIIGVTRDPQFGLALTIGAGGVLTELLKDAATVLLPTTRDEIETAAVSLKCWKLVTGFRGKSGNAAAVIEAIEAVARFALANGDKLEELDVNPLLVLPQGAVAVDALIRMRTTQ